MKTTYKINRETGSRIHHLGNDLTEMTSVIDINANEHHGKTKKSIEIEDCFIEQNEFTKLPEVLDKKNGVIFRETVLKIFYHQYERMKKRASEYVHDFCDADEIVSEAWLNIFDNYAKYEALITEDEKPLKMVLGLAVYKAVEAIYKNYRDTMTNLEKTEAETIDDDGNRTVKTTYSYKTVTSYETFDAETLLFGDYNENPETIYIKGEHDKATAKKLQNILRHVDTVYPWYRDVIQATLAGKTIKQIAIERGVQYKKLTTAVYRARHSLAELFDRDRSKRMLMEAERKRELKKRIESKTPYKANK